MYKSLTALTVLGAFVGTAVAANVTLYGVIDQSFNVTHIRQRLCEENLDISAGQNFSGMVSGLQETSHIGIKGQEDLGNGLSVGFVLENGFAADSGTMNSRGRLFDREANLFIRGPLGELSFGRVGNLQSGYGSYGLTKDTSPFGTSYGMYAANIGYLFLDTGWLDNTITYKSPTFSGVTAYAQYSLKINSDRAGVEGRTSSNRYSALGLTYTNGALKLVGVLDSIRLPKLSPYDNSRTFSFGGSYDFEIIKVYAGAQIFSYNLGAKGYGVTTGVALPALGGTAKAAFIYRLAQLRDLCETSEKDFRCSLGYEYPLSQRTNLYSVASYGNLRENWSVFRPNTGILSWV